MNNFLELNTDKEKNNDIFDDVQIVIDPELEDESTIDINNYLNKFILQCRVCGNMFPSTELLDNETECPICDSKSSDGFIFKGKLKKNVEKEEDKKYDSNKESAIDELFNANDDEQIPISGDFDKYKKDGLSNNYVYNK